MAFLNWIWGGIKWFFGLIIPVFGKVGRSQAVGTGVRWILHFLFVFLVLLGLHFLNRHYDFPKYLRAQHWFIQDNFLPILALLVYALCWLGFWIWKLLVTEPEYPEFADLTEAWEEGVAALAQVGIDPRDLPLFLVLGRPEAPIDGFFQATKLKFEVPQTPSRSSAPLHVYATREAIYVTCQGASLLGRHAANLAGDFQGTGRSSEEIQMPGEGGGGDELERTNIAGKQRGADAEVVSYMGKVLAEKRETTPAERRRLRGLMRQDPRGYTPLIKKPDEMARLAPRFEAFCRLLVQDRLPFCPINGILILVPFSATESDQDAIDTGDTIRHDLAIAKQTLQVNAAKLAVLCDLETANGYSEFLSGFVDKQRDQRIGQRFPLVPLLDGVNGRTKDPVEAHARLVEGLAGSICNTVVPGWVYKHFRLESPRKGYAEVLGSNAQLFQFMHQFRERQRRLGLLLSHALATQGDEPPLLGGCYLAGTGADAARERSFVAGVFRRLSDEENSVSWTDEALMEEAGYQRWIATGQTILAVLVLLSLALLGYWFLNSGKK